MSIEDYQTDLFDVERTTQTRSTIGGVADDWVATLSNQLGKFSPLQRSKGEVVTHGALEIDADVRLYCKVIDVQEKDRIKRVSDGVYFDVKYVRNPMEFDRFLEIDLKEI